MGWGSLELAGDDAVPGAAPEDPTYAILRRKVGQLRAAQDAGHLDPAWDAIDILVLVSQIATSWAGQLDVVQAAAGQVRDPSLAARRAAVVAAVQRLFPAAASRENG